MKQLICAFFHQKHHEYRSSIKYLFKYITIECKKCGCKSYIKAK